MFEKVIETARKAGEATLEYYNQEIEVETKEDDSPLTKADLAAHKIITEALETIDPETPVISEEGGLPSYEERKHWEKFWIVDPLDGTKEFIKKNGEFTINIALVEQGEPVFGVVYVPARQVTYYGSKQDGSFRQDGAGDPVRIYSEQADKLTPLKVVCSRSHGSSDLEDQLKKQGITVEETMPAGSSIKFCLVAEGKADIYPRMGPTMEWDVAAGDCVYRNSAKNGQHPSPLTYNKPDLKNGSFVIGLNDDSMNKNRNS
ncbi:3'(2'),5'-bisphosphate nucleotidase CysQ [Halalkalibaculum sp. DA3122]|uniref:3'(2'),5'-bisphosphate nucleotidase CysQ n=1 Tax=Halalkalibaculum sp. DA3122 TaxID=3373607 RepID=UPI003754299E